MTRLGLERDIVDRAVYDRSVERFRQAAIVLPTLSELADPTAIPPAVRNALGEVDPDQPQPLNLFRVHWFNAADRRTTTSVPEHLVLPRTLTGTAAPIVVALGNRFPMIEAHKVLAAYGCLVPRIITGQFDPTANRALWPSTGNYCRGGVAISRILGCHGIAILPAGMSRERFDWLERWVTDPTDIVRTPGSESNVKEIYDKCHELAADPANIVFNQFCEFGNHLVHWHCTGRALARVFEQLRRRHRGLRLHAFVSATGSAGTLAAGDRLKDELGARIVAVEAVECPTLLRCGFGEHNIQGIGDKHVPLIHNAMNTDVVVGVSDRSTDALDLLFNDPAGREYLAQRGRCAPKLAEALSDIGISGIANVAAAIKLAKYHDLGPDDAILTVATDGAEMYRTERDRTRRERFGGRFDHVACGEVYGEHLAGLGTGDLLELTHDDRKRIFNQGYFTWVEQQGISLDDFTARRSQSFWRGLRDLVPAWDARIEEFNESTGARARL